MEQKKKLRETISHLFLVLWTEMNFTLKHITVYKTNGVAAIFFASNESSHREPLTSE